MSRLTLALTAEEKDLLERAARLNGRSLSSELAVRVRRSLGEREPQGAEASFPAGGFAAEPGSRSPSDLSLAGSGGDGDKAGTSAAGRTQGHGAEETEGPGRVKSSVVAALPASDLAGKVKPDPRAKGRR